VPTNVAILTDDAIWADPVEAGFVADNIHPFDKPDLDSEVQASFSSPRDFDYVISARSVREGVLAPELKIARATFTQAPPIVTFGEGPNRVEVRQVENAS